jgi:hypothetical protein
MTGLQAPNAYMVDKLHRCLSPVALMQKMLAAKLRLSIVSKLQAL